MLGRPLLALALCAATLGCDQPITQLVVVVDSDYAPGTELAAVDVGVASAGGETETRTFTLASSGVPFSLGVVPRGGDTARGVTITVRGRTPDGAMLVTQSVRTGFIAGQSLLVPIFLARRCSGVPCEAETTCRDGACTTIDVPPSSLRPVRPGEELAARDAGAFDGGGDGDAGERDAGDDVDAGAFDAGTLDAATTGGVDFVSTLGQVTCGDGTLALVTSTRVPVGHTLLATLAYRDGSAGAVSVSDGANTYLVELAPSASERMHVGVAVARITTELPAGSTITATFPSGSRSTSLVVDELRGGAAADPVLESAVTTGSSTAPLGSLTVGSGAYVHAVLAVANRTGFMTPPAWSHAGGMEVACTGAPGNSEHWTYYGTFSGTASLSTTLGTSRDWTLALIALRGE